MTYRRRWIRGVLSGGVTLAALAAVLTVGVIAVDWYLNPVLDQESPPLSSEAETLHRSLFVVDLHADTLLWDRDMIRRAGRGHVDLPRLIEGNVAPQ